MNLLALFPFGKFAAAGVVLLALAAGVWKIRHNGIVVGRAEVQAKWNIENEQRAGLARRSLAEKTKANEGVDRDQQILKKRDAATAAGTAGSLRRYAQADDSADTATECRADDPRPSIARECTGAFKLLDDHARSLASQVTGLQSYAANVCLSTTTIKE